MLYDVYLIFTHVLEAHPIPPPTLQVMRKKTVPETLTIKKKISKSSNPSNMKGRQIKRAPKNTENGTGAATPMQKVDQDATSSNGDVRDDGCRDNENRERSVTPTESDLLRYLNVHITPPKIDNLTSFELSREEYLDGIIELVQSDCPEVVRDMDSFIEAMKKAFKYNMEGV